MLKPGQRRGNLRRKTHRQLAAWLRRAQLLDGLQFRDASVMANALAGTLEARHLYGYLQGGHTSVVRERRFVRALIDGLFGRG